jgi:hypothetical protein
MLTSIKKWFIPVGILAISFLYFSCGSASDEPKTETKDIDEIRAMENDEMVEKGRYLVTSGLCNDCHSPKTFDAAGMHIDTTKALSGSPANMALPPIHASSLTPGNWILMSSDVTSFVGPWGISFAANLTPDSATGIGTWSKEMFLMAIRNGKHQGLETGRPIMPPMPWEEVRKMKDEDLACIFAYLKSLPPVTNKVKEHIAPPDAMKLASAK